MILQPMLLFVCFRRFVRGTIGTLQSHMRLEVLAPVDKRSEATDSLRGLGSESDFAIGGPP